MLKFSRKIWLGMLINVMLIKKIYRWKICGDYDMSERHSE